MSGDIDIELDTEEGSLTIGGEYAGVKARFRIFLAKRYVKWIAIGAAALAIVLGGLRWANLI